MTQSGRKSLRVADEIKPKSINKVGQSRKNKLKQFLCSKTENFRQDAESTSSPTIVTTTNSTGIFQILQENIFPFNNCKI